MQQNRRRNTSLIIGFAGLFVIVISLAADVLGLGAEPGVIGWKQWLGAGAGAVMVAFAIWSRAR